MIFPSIGSCFATSYHSAKDAPNSTGTLSLSWPLPTGITWVMTRRSPKPQDLRTTDRHPNHHLTPSMHTPLQSHLYRKFGPATYLIKIKVVGSVSWKSRVNMIYYRFPLLSLETVRYVLLHLLLHVLNTCCKTFFAFRLEMHIYIRCDNQYKTGANRENILRHSRRCLCAWVYAFWARRMNVKWGVTLFMCWL